MRRVHREATERVGANRLGRNGMRGSVHREGCGVPQNGQNGPSTVETGVLFIGRGVAYRKMGLHRILFISTVDLLQPPRATVHPSSTSSSLHLRLFIHGLLFIQPPPRYSTGYCSTIPLHGLLFNHPSTGYCSSSPPPPIVHPALHGVVLFIQPSTGSCSSSPNRLDRSGSCSSRGNTTGSCSSSRNGLYYNGVLFIQPPPPTTLTVHLGAASIGFS